MRRRIKTSITLDCDIHDKIKAIAKRQERSVSFIIEHFICDCVRELRDGNTRPWQDAKL
jgi:predicted transcriptional regulator